MNFSRPTQAPLPELLHCFPDSDEKNAQYGKLLGKLHHIFLDCSHLERKKRQKTIQLMITGKVIIIPPLSILLR